MYFSEGSIKKKECKPDNLKKILEEWDNYQNSGCENEWEVS